ncbi:hypothetical protein J4212_07490 [Candidatus Woesearchaeota archaeon]|nr:hypothetical protein [Candidatus Woesearchaeota archaeon]
MATALYEPRIVKGVPMIHCYASGEIGWGHHTDTNSRLLTGMAQEALGFYNSARIFAAKDGGKNLREGQYSLEFQKIPKALRMHWGFFNDDAERAFYSAESGTGTRESATVRSALQDISIMIWNALNSGQDWGMAEDFNHVYSVEPAPEGMQQISNLLKISTSSRLEKLTIGAWRTRFHPQNKMLTEPYSLEMLDIYRGQLTYDMHVVAFVQIFSDAEKLKVAFVGGNLDKFLDEIYRESNMQRVVKATEEWPFTRDFATFLYFGDFFRLPDANPKQ